MIKNFTPRIYQQTILGTIVKHHSLVVLPTGLGKTALAFLLAAQRLRVYPNSKILMLAPTKPLCEQHLESFRKHLEIAPEKIVLFTGNIKPEKRAEMWKESMIVVSTPQGMENDIINKRVNLQDVSGLIFDEAHHATGEYSYVWIAQQYDKTVTNSRILALTASPGSDLEKVKEVCHNLKIEKVEVRTEKDPDVQPYIQKIKKNWLKVEFPEKFKEVQKYLQNCSKSKLVAAQSLGYCNRSSLHKGELLKLQGELQRKISSGERDFSILKSISLIAEALKVEHALELLESQGLRSLQIYLQKIQREAITSKVKAVKNLAIDPNFKSAQYLTNEIVEKNILHPKIIKLKEIIQQQISQNRSAKMIVFTQFRDSAEEIVNQLEKSDGLEIKTHIFVGQAKKNGVGFSQKKQKEVLDKFRVGEFNVLVATSVAEEGLDIPKVDKVIFYEPIPSAIRSIQRRGRTGRSEEGEVTILMTAGTRDEAYRWSAHHKEKRMYTSLDKLKEGLKLALPSVKDNQDSLLKYSNLNKTQPGNIPLRDKLVDSTVAVLADHREKNNSVVKELINLNISVKTAQLESADYLVSGKVAVELKKVADFVASIVDGRLMAQLKDLKNNFEKAVVIVEGEEDIYSVRRVHANAIRGMLSAIVLDFGIPVLYTKNSLDTAALLAVMAKREQNREVTTFSPHQMKPRSVREQQEYIVSSFPNMGMQTARLLLENFGTIKKLANTTMEELLIIKGIGKKTAQNIVNLFSEKYQKKK